MLLCHANDVRRDPPSAPLAQSHLTGAAQPERAAAALSAPPPFAGPAPLQMAQYSQVQGTAPYATIQAAPYQYVAGPGHAAVGQHVGEASGHMYAQPVQYVQLPDGSIHAVVVGGAANGYAQHAGAGGGPQGDVYYQSGAAAPAAQVVYAPSVGGEPAYACAQYTHPPHQRSDTASRY